MSDHYFEVYKDKKVYRSLASKDFIKSNYHDCDMYLLVEECFSDAETYSDSLSSLSNILNQTGVRAYRARFAKYKSSLKTKSEKKQINISQYNYDKITTIMAKLGDGTTYDELIEYLLDPSEEFINEIKRELKSTSLKAFIKSLPYEYTSLLDAKIKRFMTEAFIAGIKSVPIDARKRTRVDAATSHELDELIENFNLQDVL